MLSTLEAASPLILAIPELKSGVAFQDAKFEAR